MSFQVFDADGFDISIRKLRKFWLLYPFVGTLQIIKILDTGLVEEVQNAMIVEADLINSMAVIRQTEPPAFLQENLSLVRNR
jgi:hypothetical protein